MNKNDNMCFKKLSYKGFVDEFKDVSEGPHSRKFCFILGAGASKSSGIKTGQELVDIWERELIERNEQDYFEWKENLNITDENKYGFYSQYYEKRYNMNPTDGMNFLEKMMDSVTPNVGYVVLAYILTHTNNNVVITTNFDHLTEDAVNFYENTIPLIIGHENLSHYITEQINRPTIIKIHRDLLFDPKNTTDAVSALHTAWHVPLGKIFSEYHPVFIGYAGNDSSFMDFLIDNNENFNSRQWKSPYWIFYKGEKPNEKTAEFMGRTIGNYINSNGFDELLCFLGSKLGYEMSSEEEFLENTRKRYKKLIEAFENIVDKSSLNNNRTNTSPDKIEPQNYPLGQAVQKITSQTNIDKNYLNAVTLHDKGNYKDALELEKKLVEADPNNARYHYIMSKTLLETEKYDEAEKAIKKAIEIMPDNALYHYFLGEVYHRSEKYKEAIREKKKAIEIDPNHAFFHCSLGITLYELKLYDEAETEIKNAIRINPSDDYYYNELGSVLSKTNKYDEAETAFKKAIDLAPNHAFHYFCLGDLYYLNKKNNEAEKMFKKAIELEPEDAFYHYNLGNFLLEQKKELDKAEEEIKTAVKIDPNNKFYIDCYESILKLINKYKAKH